jgi:hypothetical protein
MTPSELPWQRATDRPPEGDGLAGAAAQPERSLWSKAALLDASPARDATSDAERPAGLRNDIGPDDPASPARRDPALLDGGRPAPATEIATTGDDTQRSIRDVGDGHLSYDIHEQKSVEILDNEWPLVDRVVNVVDNYLDRVSPDGWDDANPIERSEIISELGKDIQHAMGLSEVRMYTVDLDICGLYDRDEDGHYVQVADHLDLESTISTIAHELRHAQQREIIQGVGTHPDSESWAQNNVEYKSFEGDLDAYFTQPLEADAFGFERAIGKILRFDWPQL